MLTAQRASELHPGWVPFTSSLRLLCALVSHTQQQQFCVLCFQTCALNSALFKFNSASDEQLKFRQKKKKTNPLQGAATMTEYVQVINPHYTTRSTGPISRGYVWGGCGRGGVCAQVHAANEGRRECPQQPRGGPRRHRHSTPSDGDEVAAAVEQHRKSSVWTADPEVFFTWGGDRWPTAPASFGGNYCSYTLQARAPSDSHNRCDWTTFLSDHLSPAHQHGKCAH